MFYVGAEKKAGAVSRFKFCYGFGDCKAAAWGGEPEKPGHFFGQGGCQKSRDPKQNQKKNSGDRQTVR